MISHHPDKELLLEHSAGTLSWTTSIAVAAHLQMCLQCRQEVHNLNDIGGALLESATPRQANQHLFKRTLALIDHIEGERKPEANTTKSSALTYLHQGAADRGSRTNRDRRADSSEDGEAAFDESALEAREQLRRAGVMSSADLPPVVRKLVPHMGTPRWRAPKPSLRLAELARGSGGECIALLEIAPGAAMPEHHHKGRELTLVLSGQFSDSDGLYLPGDLLIKEPNQLHRPVATLDRPCLCLYINEGPMAPMHQLAAMADRLLASLPFGKFGDSARPHS